jgi:hypothetical protein
MLPTYIDHILVLLLGLALPFFRAYVAVKTRVFILTKGPEEIPVQ